MAVQSIGTRRQDLNTIQVHYVAPPQGANPLAAYAAEYLNILTPVAKEVHMRRLRAMDPLEQQRMMLQYQRAQRSAAWQRAQSAPTHCVGLA